MTETTETIKGPAAEPRRLTRSRENRWLGGVSAGLGEYFDLNPIVYRIAFVALALAGGTGILLYVAAWLVIPDAGEDDSIAATAIKEHRERPWLVIGVGLLAFGAILALSEARFWPNPGNLWLAAALAGGAIVWWQVSTHSSRRAAAAPSASGTAVAAAQPAAPKPRRRSLLPVATGLLIGGLGLVGLLDATGAIDADWRIVLAAAALGLGVLVAVGALTGMRVGGVVVLGLGVLAALALAFAVHVPLFSGIGNETSHPATVAAVHSTLRARHRRLPRRPAGRHLPGRQHAREGDARDRQPDRDRAARRDRLRGRTRERRQRAAARPRGQRHARPREGRAEPGRSPAGCSSSTRASGSAS